MVRKIFLVIVLLAVSVSMSPAKSLDIPSKHWGISFGNSTEFTGLRFNILDKNIDRIDGVNISVWHGEDFDNATGKFRGLGIGLPLASGTADRKGVSVGLFGVAAAEDIAGINLAGLAIGSGRNLAGINVAGLAVGSGENIKGLNVALLAVGCGENAWGINVAGLAVGSGENLSGINIGGLAAGAGENIAGITLSLLAAGSGENITGLTAAGLAAGAGESIKGITMAGLAVGCGGTMTGISLAILAVGAPEVKGLQAALVVGGEDVGGISLAPAYFTIKGDHGEMTGISVSAFNHIRGYQRGVAIGIFNFTYDIKGIQLGVLNHVESNPRYLRWLPIFNTHF